MKGFLILSLMLTSLFLKEENKITITPDKQVYKQGEIIKFKVKAKKKFQLATNGDCSSSVLPPSYVMEIDGRFPYPSGIGQLCCGLPCAGSFKKYEFSQRDTLAIGRWKVMLLTCDRSAGMVESSVFEVIE